MADGDEKKRSDAAEDGVNRTDPIPDQGGRTQQDLKLKKGGAAAVDDALYGAMVSGNEQLVLSRFASLPDGPISDTQVAVLEHARREEEAKAYQARHHKTEEVIAFRRKEKHHEHEMDSALRAVDESKAQLGTASSGEGVPRQASAASDEYGGHTGQNGEYYDRFGGHYDQTGYQSKDGSYTALTGAHYDAKTNTITEPDGKPRDVPPELSSPAGKQGVVKVEAAVVALDSNAPAGKPPTPAAKAAAAGGPGGMLGAMGHLAAATVEQQQVADQVALDLKHQGLALEARNVTRERIAKARAAIDARRQAVEAGMHDFAAETSAVPAVGAAPGPVKPADFTAITEDDAVKKLGHLHTPDLVGKPGTPAEAPSKTENWYADSKGGLYDDQGGYYDKWGGYWDKTGGHWDKDGGYIDKHDGYTYPDGAYLDAKNNYVDKSGNLTLADGTYYKAQPGTDFKAQLMAAAEAGKDWTPPEGLKPDALPTPPLPLTPPSASASLSLPTPAALTDPAQPVAVVSPTQAGSDPAAASTFVPGSLTPGLAGANLQFSSFTAPAAAAPAESCSLYSTFGAFSTFRDVMYDTSDTKFGVIPTLAAASDVAAPAAVKAAPAPAAPKMAKRLYFRFRQPRIVAALVDGQRLRSRDREDAALVRIRGADDAGAAITVAAVGFHPIPAVKDRQLVHAFGLEAAGFGDHPDAPDAVEHDVSGALVLEPAAELELGGRRRGLGAILGRRRGNKERGQQHKGGDRAAHKLRAPGAFLRIRAAGNRNLP
jgi:hypothetical protein